MCNETIKISLLKMYVKSYNVTWCAIKKAKKFKKPSINRVN